MKDTKSRNGYFLLLRIVLHAVCNCACLVNLFINEVYCVRLELILGQDGKAGKPGGGTHQSRRPHGALAQVSRISGQRIPSSCRDLELVVRWHTGGCRPLRTPQGVARGPASRSLHETRNLGFSIFNCIAPCQSHLSEPLAGFVDVGWDDCHGVLLIKKALSTVPGDLSCTLS